MQNFIRYEYKFIVPKNYFSQYLFPQHNNIRYNDAPVIICIESSSYSIWCCKAYVIQKRSKGLSFGIGYEHFVSTVLVSLWIAVFYSYIYLQKVIKSYLVNMICYKYIYVWNSWLNIFIICSIIGPMLSMVPTVFVKLSVVINPVLYIALNSQVTFDIKYRL